MVYHVVLFCISITTNDVEHVFLCVLATCTASLEKCQVVCAFLNWIVFSAALVFRMEHLKRELWYDHPPLQPK